MKLTFSNRPTPILLIGDAPEGLGGLARIGRDLAGLLSQMPEFRVGYMARGGVGRRGFAWTQYNYPEAAMWGTEFLPGVWHDFARGENGIVFSTWDASRMLWLAQPGGLGKELETFLGEGRNFEKWGYFPFDGTGPRDILPAGMRATVAGYDRVCAASDWGTREARMVRADAEWLPHGIWMDKFQISKPLQIWDHKLEVHLGCNMSNQARKDWPTAFECAATLRAHYGNRFRAWFHTDQPIHYWNFYGLATDYEIGDCLEVTTDLTDEQLALRYSGCDCTILPSGGEGFGYPIAESMACGTACIVADYAGGAELVEEACRVEPMAYRIDTIHNVRRAVLSGYGFAQKAIGQIEEKRRDWEYRAGQMREQVEHLDWGKLRVVWERWLRKGIA